MCRERDAAVTVSETAALAAGEFDADDRVVALGERALLAVGRVGVDAPVLPVGGESLPNSPTLDDLDTVVETVLAADPDVVDHPILSIGDDSGTERARAVLDVTLVTDEPARISEYAVRAGDREIDRFRADGVVVATPLGSGGYASAVGGPRLGPGTGLAVVPVSPFETQRDYWVVADPVALSVERDDSAVSLVADDTVVGAVGPEERLTVRPTGTLAVLRPDES
nr:ATP-NAD kinase [Salinirubrum litoreum]